MAAVIESTQQKLSFVDRNPHFMAGKLSGMFGESAWMQSVFVLSQWGEIPGASFAAEYLQRPDTETKVFDALVDGALSYGFQHNVFDHPTADDPETREVRRALTTALVWAEKKRQDGSYGLHYRFIQRITAQQPDDVIEDVVAWQHVSWQMLEKGLGELHPDVFDRSKSGDPTHVMDTLLIDMIRANLREQSQYIQYRDTSGMLVERLMEHGLTGDRLFTPLYALVHNHHLFRAVFDGRDAVERSPQEQDAIFIASHVALVALVDRVASAMSDTSRAVSLCRESVRYLPYRRDWVRRPLLDRIFTVVEHAEDRFELVQTELTYGEYQTAAILLRGISPEDSQDVIRMLTKKDDVSVLTELALTYAWWESQETGAPNENPIYEHRVAQAVEYLTFLRNRRSYAYHDAVRYMPRMMDYSGALDVVEHGLRSREAHDRDQASVGLLTAIAAWHGSEMGISLELQKYLIEWVSDRSDFIPPSRMDAIMEYLNHR